MKMQNLEEYAKAIDYFDVSKRMILKNIPYKLQENELESITLTSKNEKDIDLSKLIALTYSYYIIHHPKKRIRIMLLSDTHQKFALNEEKGMLPEEFVIITDVGSYAHITRNNFSNLEELAFAE